MRRSLTDPNWADEVIRRWNRRRFHVQQRQAAMRDLKAAFEPPLVILLTAIDRLLRKWPWLYRHLED